jgi:hypothetical protein
MPLQQPLHTLDANLVLHGQLSGNDAVVVLRHQAANVFWVQAVA